VLLRASRQWKIRYRMTRTMSGTPSSQPRI
jgi:hypothetical protein